MTTFSRVTPLATAFLVRVMGVSPAALPDWTSAWGCRASGSAVLGCVCWTTASGSGSWSPAAQAWGMTRLAAISSARSSDSALFIFFLRYSLISNT